MQIGSYMPRFSMPLENRSKISGAAKTASADKAPEKEDFSSHFSGPDDVTVTHTAGGGVGYSMLSPFMRLEAQWERWRAQLGEDPDANLPDSTGWTEENIEYLKNRYSSDELTWVEREDVLETMRKLGMISGNQQLMAHGGELRTLAAGTFAMAGGTKPIESKAVEIENDFNDHDPLERDWNVLFKGKPITGFLKIDDILDWAKDLPDDSWDPWRLIMEKSGQITE